MGSLGIGLGGFARGFDRGYDLGSTIVEDTRTLRNRRDLERVDDTARTQFEHAVASGTAEPGDFDQFYTSYIVPMKAAELMKQGDLAGAEAWRTWADGDQARRGAKLFSQAIVAGQSGNMSEAARLFMEAGRVKGYGPDYKLKSFTPDDDGSGYNLTITGSDGDEQSIEFADRNEFLEWGSTVYNPEQAFTAWQTAQAAGKSAESSSIREITQSLAIKRGEAEIEKEFGTDIDTSDYGEAWKHANELSLAEKGFGDWKPRKQERWLRDRAKDYLTAGGLAGGPDAAAPAAPGLGPAGKGGKTQRFNPTTGDVEDVPAPLGNQATTGDALVGPGGAVAGEEGEDLGGGAGGDLLTGSAGGNGLAGGAGSDRVAGGGARTPPDARRLIRQLGVHLLSLEPGSSEHNAVLARIDELRNPPKAAPAKKGRSTAKATGLGEQEEEVNVPNPPMRPEVAGISGGGGTDVLPGNEDIPQDTGSLPFGIGVGGDPTSGYPPVDPRTKDDVLERSLGVQATKADALAPTHPAGPDGPPDPQRPPYQVRLRQLAVQAAKLKPGSPEHQAVQAQIQQLQADLDNAAMSGY